MNIKGVIKKFPLGPKLSTCSGTVHSIKPYLNMDYKCTGHRAVRFYEMGVSSYSPWDYAGRRCPWLSPTHLGTVLDEDVHGKLLVFLALLLAQLLQRLQFDERLV